MKKEDIEKLKEFCEREGFELKRKPSPGIEFEIRKKDPWDGVEFARCVNKDAKHFTTGKIYKLRDGKSIHDDLAFLDDNGNINGYSPCNTERFQPATEQEYVNQLMEESWERFGEIKEGDRFVDPGGGEWGMDEITEDFRYEKDNDFLYFNDYIIYDSGKWAKKVEKAKVTFVSSKGASNTRKNGMHIGGTYDFSFKIENVEHKNLHHIGERLANEIENYLNENSN